MARPPGRGLRRRWWVQWIAAATLVTGCQPSSPIGTSPIATPAVQASSPQPGVSASLEADHDVRLPSERQISVRCAGRGPGSVLLVSGYGVNMANSWNPVQAGIGAFSRTCAFDRLGEGSSDEPPPLETFASIADDMDQLITALSLTRPVMVVAHSLGGPIAMTWASGHISDVKGILLLDPSTPEDHVEGIRQVKNMSDTTDPFRVEVETFENPAFNREHLDPTSWEPLLSLPRLGPVPLIVLAHDKPPILSSSAVDVSKLDAANRAGHHRWAAMSDSGIMTVVPDAQHFIQIDHSQLVIDTVHTLTGG